MANLTHSGPAGNRNLRLGYFSDHANESANPPRVDGWLQERPAVATRGVPSGVWQGSMWRSST